MSKAPKNIEKILLGVAVVAAGGLVALGFMKKGAVDEEFPAASGGVAGSEGTGVDGMQRVRGTINSLTSDRQWAAASVEAPKAKGGQRPVSLTVGVDLFARRDNPNEPFDPLRSDDIHDGIPNTWWLEHGVPMVYADSPQRDHDGDGFSNQEEFTAGTEPSNRNSHPDPVAKLMYVNDESEPWYLDYGMETGGKWYPRLKDVGNGSTINRPDFGEGFEPGDTFFTDPEKPMPNRFKFLKLEQRKRMNERLNTEETVDIAIFEDLRPNKQGLQYEIERGLPRARIPNFIQYDRTAVLDLQALGMAGREFKVEERTDFALPPDAEEKKYHLKSVTPEQIEVTWTEDGEERSVTIPKGQLPQMDQ